MAWITLSETNLGERLAAEELEALQTAAVGDFGNTVPDVLASVVAEVRGRVAAESKNQLGPTGTIPEELKSAALAIARWRILSRLPGMKFLQDEARRAEYSDALSLLAAVADGKFAIVQPENPIEANTGVVEPSISTKCSHWSRQRQNGA